VAPWAVSAGLSHSILLLVVGGGEGDKQAAQENYHCGCTSAISIPRTCNSYAQDVEVASCSVLLRHTSAEG
jgi:hypothetical protein